MPPRTEWAKSPVAIYIYKHRKEQTRYEIDLTLLQAGHAPEEIEAAWQLFNSTLPRPLTIKNRLIAFLLLFGSLLLGIFTWGFSYFWPFVLFNAVIYPIIALISSATAITIFVWVKKRVKAKYMVSSVHLLTMCLLSIIFAISTLVAGLIYISSGSTKEVASLKVQKNNYYLVNSDACLDFCSKEIVLYRCSFFNLVCPQVESLSFHLGNNALDTIISNINNASLKIDPDTGKLLLLEDNKVAYTFKNV